MGSVKAHNAQTRSLVRRAVAEGQRNLDRRTVAAKGGSVDHHRAEAWKHHHAAEAARKNGDAAKVKQHEAKKAEHVKEGKALAAKSPQAAPKRTLQRGEDGGIYYVGADGKKHYVDK